MNSFKPKFSVSLGLPLSIFLLFSVFSFAQSSQQATLVKDIQVGVDNSNPDNFTAVGNTMYFTTRMAGGSNQLWKTDGTATGTVKVDSILGNPQSYNGKLYFTKKFSKNFETENAVLWSYNGTNAAIIDTIKEGYGLIPNTLLSVIGSNLSVQVNSYADLLSPNKTTDVRYFTKGVKGDFKNGGTTGTFLGCVKTSYTNFYLNDTLAFYRTSLNICGSGSVSELYSVKKGKIWSISQTGITNHIKPLDIINNRLIFIGLPNETQYDALVNFNLYSIGVDGDATILKSGVGYADYFGPNMTFNNKIYYSDPTYKIWETDGTANGTIVLTDGVNNALPLGLGNPTVMGDGLYFIDETSTDFRIWKIDTTGNIRKIITIPNLNDKTVRIRVINNELYHFSTANTNTVDKQISLYKIDVVNGTRQNIGTFYGLDYLNQAVIEDFGVKYPLNFGATSTKLYASANNPSTASNPTGQEPYQLSLDATCANDNVAPYFGNCPTSSVKIITTEIDTSWVSKPTAFDNCSTPNVTLNLTGVLNFTEFPIGIRVITSKDSTARFEYSATDAKGNIGKCIYTVKVEKPCVASTATFNTTCPKDTVISTLDACTRVSWQVPTAIDNCGNSSAVYQSQGLPTGSCFAVGVNRIVYKKTLGSDSCTFKITVNQTVNPCATDTIAPVFQTCPANINLTTAGTNAIATWATPTATDNCSYGAVNLGNYSSGFAFPLGVSSVVYTATDLMGNKGYCNFTVTVSPQNIVKDVCTNPAANVVGKSSSITITGIKTSSAIIQIFNSAWTTVYNQQVSADSVTISNLVSGSYNVKVTVLEAGGRWPAVCESVVNNVNVSTGINPCDVDNTVPSFSNCPANIVLNSSTSTAIATWTAPTATDNCGTPSVLSNYNSGFAFPLGTTTVTYTATDAKANKTTCSFTVTVTQQVSNGDICTNPTANVVGSSGSILVTGITTSSAAIQVFTSTWNSVFNQQISGTSATIPNLAAGKYIVKVTVLGTGGKWPAVCNVQVDNVTVTNGTTPNPCATDVTPPTFSNCPTNINLTTSGTSATATWTAPTATDNCTTAPSVLSNYNSGFAFPLGTTAVTYTATDAKGNKATCSFNVAVAQSLSCRQRDSLILVDVYNSMGGANWVNKWDLTKPINTWIGIGTDSNGCVIALTPLGLIGNLSPSIGNLSQLKYLRLGGSKAITGTIPSSFSNLSNLVELQLEENKMTGNIPDFVGNLLNLDQVLLYKNMFTGSIPSSFGNLKKLRTLILNNNQLSGDIPSSMSNMTALTSLELSNNLYTSISEVFGTIKTLYYLGLDNNRLTNSIPKNLSELTNLYELKLSNNLLTGCIPIELKALCGKDVNLTNNPNLPGGGDWAAFCSSNTGICPANTTDLELTMSSNPSVFKKWTTINTVVSVKNKSNQAFTNIEINVPAPKGTSAGGTGLPTVGTWQPYCAGGVLCYKWTIPSLAANATATLTIPLFVLNVDTAIVATAKLLSSSPVDNNNANNTATIIIVPASTQQIQGLSYRKPTQYIPVIVQKITPNPTDGDVYIDVESLDERDMRFEFFNAQGQTVHSEMQHLKKGSNQLFFNLTDKQSGLYFVKPETSGGRNVPVKFVKL